MSDIGFTGSRLGKTAESDKAFRAFLAVAQPAVFRNGLCIGWDGQAVRIVREMFPTFKIIGYPGRGMNDVADIRPDRDWAAQEMCDEVMVEQSHFARNRAIVNACERMIACPASKVMTSGGTLYTINYAKKTGRPMAIICPDGTENFER